MDYLLWAFEEVRSRVLVEYAVARVRHYLLGAREAWLRKNMQGRRY